MHGDAQSGRAPLRRVASEDLEEMDRVDARAHILAEVVHLLACHPSWRGGHHHTSAKRLRREGREARWGGEERESDRPYERDGNTHLA